MCVEWYYIFATRCIISSFKEQQELSMMLKVGLIRIGMLSSHHACELFVRCFRTIWTVMNRKSRYSFIDNIMKSDNSDLDLKEYLTMLIVSSHVRSALSGKCGILDITFTSIVAIKLRKFWRTQKLIQRAKTGEHFATPAIVLWISLTIINTADFSFIEIH